MEAQRMSMATFSTESAKLIITNFSITHYVNMDERARFAIRSQLLCNFEKPTTKQVEFS